MRQKTYFLGNLLLCSPRRCAVKQRVYDELSTSVGAFDRRGTPQVRFAFDFGRRITDPFSIGRSDDGCRRCGGDFGRGGNEQPESKCGEAAWWVGSRVCGEADGEKSLARMLQIEVCEAA